MTPFVRAFAGQAATDTYVKLKKLVGRTRKSLPVAGQPAPATGYIRIADPCTGLQIIVPEPIPLEAIRALRTMDMSELKDRRPS